MTFRREVYDRMWLITIEQGSQLCPVADVGLREGVARVSASLWDRGEIGSVRQLIDVDHVCAGLIEQVPDHCRSDKSGAAGYEQCLSVKTHVGLYRPKLRCA